MACGDHLIIAPQLNDITIEVSPFAALQNHRPFRVVARHDLALVDPAEIKAVQIPIPHLQPKPCSRRGRIPLTHHRSRLPLVNLPEQFGAIDEHQVDETFLPEVA